MVVWEVFFYPGVKSEVIWPPRARQQKCSSYSDVCRCQRAVQTSERREKCFCFVVEITPQLTEFTRQLRTADGFLLCKVHCSKHWWSLLLVSWMIALSLYVCRSIVIRLGHCLQLGRTRSLCPAFGYNLDILGHPLPTSTNYCNADLYEHFRTTWHQNMNVDSYVNWIDIIRQCAGHKTLMRCAICLLCLYIIKYNKHFTDLHKHQLAVFVTLAHYLYFQIKNVLVLCLGKIWLAKTLSRHTR